MHPSITLIDGVEMNRLHPDTFEVPTADEKLAVQPGDHVKLGFQANGIAERIWVKVTGEGEGYLDNDPVFLPMKHKDAVKFEPHHILNIIHKE